MRGVRRRRRHARGAHQVTDAHREQETPATPCPGIQEGHYYVHCRDCGHSPVATPCPLRKAIEDEIKVCRNHQRQAQGLSRTGVANRWATIAERMENLLREHGDCGRAPATLTPFERESLDIAIAKFNATLFRDRVRALRDLRDRLTGGSTGDTDHE